MGGISYLFEVPFQARRANVQPLSHCWEQTDSWFAGAPGWPFRKCQSKPMATGLFSAARRHATNRDRRAGKRQRTHGNVLSLGFVATRLPVGRFKPGDKVKHKSSGQLQPDTSNLLKPSASRSAIDHRKFTFSQKCFIAIHLLQRRIWPTVTGDKKSVPTQARA